MEVNEELIEHVAKVARLNLTEEEKKEFTPQLKEVIVLFDELAKMELDEKPSYQPIEMKNVTRKDDPKKCLTQDEALSHTEHKKDGYFKGPRAV